MGPQGARCGIGRLASGSLCDTPGFLSPIVILLSSHVLCGFGQGNVFLTFPWDFVYFSFDLYFSRLAEAVYLMCMLSFPLRPCLDSYNTCSGPLTVKCRPSQEGLSRSRSEIQILSEFQVFKTKCGFVSHPSHL